MRSQIRWRLHFGAKTKKLDKKLFTCSISIKYLTVLSNFWVILHIESIPIVSDIDYKTIVLLLGTFTLQVTY